MKIDLTFVDNELVVVFDEEFVKNYGFSTDTAFEISTENESIRLKPVGPNLSFDGLMFERLTGNQFAAKVV